MFFYCNMTNLQFNCEPMSFAIMTHAVQLDESCKSQMMVLRFMIVFSRALAMEPQIITSMMVTFQNAD